MPLKVVSFAAYLTRPDCIWGEDDWGALKFIKAIKDKPVNGSGRVLVRGRWEHLDASNRTSAFGWFGEMAADYMAAAGMLNQRLFLVPIPCSKAVAGFDSSQTPSVLLASAAAAECERLGHDVRVVDYLRWDREMVSSHKGGTRDARVLLGHLRVMGGFIGGIPRILLIDDVFTLGGHARAAAAALRGQGWNVLGCLCAGRTVLEQPQNAFETVEAECSDLV